jgi:hypothetical protein
MPAIMVSIIPLKLFAEANVQPAHDEKQNHDSYKKQIHHYTCFKFSFNAIGAAPHMAAPLCTHYECDSLPQLIKMRKEPVKFSLNLGHVGKLLQKLANFLIRPASVRIKQFDRPDSRFSDTSFDGGSSTR